MPLVQTRGAASAQGFGEFAQASGPATYIEDVFSTYLYTGTGATRTITNNIDLSTKGGLVWIKNRDTGGYSNLLIDTVRGAPNALVSNTTDAQTSATYGLTAFTTSGFTLGTAVASDIEYNGSNKTFASWTFREQAKFFDVVTYTGTGANRTIAHSLGSVPACIMVKRTDTTAAWAVYHRSLANTQYLVLNSTAAAATGATWWNSTTPTSSVFSLGTDATVNASGGTAEYVAYLFAHDAGGFGLAGTDNVISCGSFTTDGSGIIPTVNLGYEPQWIMFKSATGVDSWYMADNMRGWFSNSTAQFNGLRANLSNAELAGFDGPILTSTGFTGPAANFGASNTFIYIAIRRGPMKVPTTGTSVFGLSARSGTGANATVTGGQTDDAVLVKNRGSAVASLFSSRLTGTGYLVTSATDAEVAAGATILQANPWDVMDGVKVGTTSTITNASSNTFINYLFKRAPSFFDEVCYTGTGVARTVTHNLTVSPEMIIVKCRSSVNGYWAVYASGLPSGKLLELDTADAAFNQSGINTPTSTTFTVQGAGQTFNGSGDTYVAYLFATCAGVSKVGTYNGTGVTQTIDCGFGAGGARFVLIKRTDSTGDWYVWDSARGMVSGTDPSLLLNSNAAEVNANSVYAISTGFQIVSTAAGINSSASGATYIFLAIA